MADVDQCARAAHALAWDALRVVGVNMETATCAISLTERQRDALRLDLEDRQSSLIAELYGTVLLQTGAMPSSAEPRLLRLMAAKAGARIPEQDLAATNRAAIGALMLGRMEILYAVNRALARIDHADFGSCSTCGAAISFDVLAGDPARIECGRCVNGAD